MKMSEIATSMDTLQIVPREATRVEVVPASPRSDAIDARLDRSSVTRVQALLIAVCALGLAVDNMEMSMGSAFSAIFSAPPNAVTPRALSWLLSAVYIGAISGAPIGGWMGQRPWRD